MCNQNSTALQTSLVVGQRWREKLVGVKEMSVFELIDRNNVVAGKDLIQVELR